MMRLFRKYNKQLLAVFMVLLMIVFIGGSALESLFAPASNPVVGRSNFGDITQRDQRIARSATDILAGLGFDWRSPMGPVAKPLTITDWVLLTREAKELGTETGSAAARAWLSTAYGADQIERLSRNIRVKPDHIYEAVAQYRSVQETARAMGSATAPGAAQVRVHARNALDKVKVKFVVLPAGAFIDEDAEVSEEALREHLAAYRDRERGPGVEFGYFVPPAVKVQYLKVNRAKVLEGLAIPNLEREARLYYVKNRETAAFARPDSGEPDTRRVTIGDNIEEIMGIEEEESPDEEKPPYLTWEESRDTAIEAIREKHADQAVQRIATWLVERTLDSFLDVDRGEDGYRSASEAVARDEYYQDLIARIPSKLSFPGAVEVAMTDFFTQGEAPTVPEIGGAGVGGKTWEGSLRSLAFKTQAIVPEVPKGDGVKSDEYLAMYQTSLRTLRAPNGDTFVFRVVGFKPGHPAESVEEVRSQLVKGVRLQRGYDRAKQLAGAVRFTAVGGDLREAFDTDPDLLAAKEAKPQGGITFVEPSPISRVLPGEAATGIRAAGVYVRSIGQVPPDQIEQLFALESADEKVAVLELESLATVAVAQWVETVRGREDEFEGMKKDLVSNMSGVGWRAVMQDWMDPEQIRVRTGFETGSQQ